VNVSRTSVAVLLAAATLLALVWHVSPPVTPPLYDGLGLPPEPYRYLNPPPALKHGNKTPSSTSLSVPVSGGESSFESAATNENPPQAQLILQPNAVRLPAGTKWIAIVVRPVPALPAPQDGNLDGNAYRFALTSNSGTLLALGKGTTSVALRGTGARGSPIIEQYTGGHWIRLKTGIYLGIAIYVANVKSLGDFALVLPGKATGASGGTALNGFLPLLVIGVLIVGLTTAGLLLIRLGRQSTPPARDA